MNSILHSNFIYEDSQTGAQGSRIVDLLLQRPERDLHWNKEFFANYLLQKPTWPLSPVVGIQKIDQGLIEPGTVRSRGSVAEILEQTFHNYFSQNEQVALALSDGLDSKLLALALRRLGYHVEAYSLKTNVKGYCEWQSTTQFAKEFGFKLNTIEVRVDDFFQCLPEYVKVTECPIYNMHPVSKFLLARELKKLGVSSIASGDGADQIWRLQTDCDLFPWTQKSFQHHAVRLVTPLAHSAFRDLAERHGSCQQKTSLRLLAQDWGLSVAPKRSSHFPGWRELPDAQSSLLYTHNLLKSQWTAKGIRECAELPAYFDIQA